MNDELNENTSTTTELNELCSHGINVWSETQATLEEQALNELEIFSENVAKNREISIVVDVPEKQHSSKGNASSTLNVDAYIKKQTELKKLQEFNKIAQQNRKELKTAPIKIKKAKKRKVFEEAVLCLEETAQSENNNIKIICDNSNNNLKEHQPKRRKAESISTPSTSAIIVSNESDIEIDPEEEEEGEICSDEDYKPLDEHYYSDDSDYESSLVDVSKNLEAKPTKKHKKRNTQTLIINKIKDDGSPECYKARLDEYYKKLEQEQSTLGLETEPNLSDHYEIQGGLKVPIKIWNSLYSYQQEGLEWLWELHKRSTGGLLGDEMGLGKTVQIIAFLYALDYSRVVSKHGRYTGLGPSIIVCPATVIHQWVKHFQDWTPEIRVAVLHQSGTYTGHKINLIREMNKCKGIIITTYLGVLKYHGDLIDLDWHYLILDEGHKIRNSSAKVTTAVKRIRTPHRLMLTGSPMQNNLQELWSLFDFTNPGMLGTSATFIEHFANPIVHGGFTNSTPMQEATALSVATALKNLITPFLLRRSKAEVQQDIMLPSKNEQILFCSLTDEQKDLYKAYLLSEHVNTILGRGSKNWYSQNQMRANMLMAITALRKICNHPDLFLYEADEELPQYNEHTLEEERYGFYKRSGKMIVVSALLKIWKKQGHRVLLFSQGRAMVSIFEEFLQLRGYTYLKMDGSTSISSRQTLIEKFNTDENHFVFLLTTRVGGLGVNLTGANRVIIYDPDWNPATDTQARERAWRIGQEKQVTIYRLLSAGTIEEKMYQRQVWKQLLSNKVLLDPRTHRFFRNSDLHDLFSLQEHNDGSNPETANIFYESRVKIEQRALEKAKTKCNKKKEMYIDTEKSTVQFSDDKILAMKNLAQQIAKSMSSSKETILEEPKKSAEQLKLEEERKKKLKEKEKLKGLSAAELLAINRKKTEKWEELPVNSFDDCNTDVSFSLALNIADQNANLYKKYKDKKHKLDLDNNDVDIQEEKLEKEDDLTTVKHNKIGASSSSTNKNKHKKSKHKHKKHEKYDLSGKIDGEEVEGLVKAKVQKNKKSSKESQHDNYVLEKLLSRKGVSGALEHDSVVTGKAQRPNLKIHTEVQMKTELALEALRKSRVNNWRW